MTAGSLTPSENHSDACPWKRFIFCDPVVVDGAIVINFYGCDRDSNINHEVVAVHQDAEVPYVSNEKKKVVMLK